MLEHDEGFIRKHADAPDLLAVINALMVGNHGRAASVSAGRTYYIH
jgi:hypothetical protein